MVSKPVRFYGPNVDRYRRVLWDEIVGLSSWWDLPWYIGGDFNITRFLNKRLGEDRLSHARTEFSEFICYMDLVNLPLAGGTCTWSNNRAWFRLDKFLAPSWEAHYSTRCSRRD